MSSNNKLQRLQFSRKRLGKTNYKKRLKLLLAEKPRVVIRKQLNNTIVQVVEYSDKGDKIIVSCHSNELKKLGWKNSTGNVPAAYLTGLLLGKKAGKAKCSEAILDIGLQKSVKGSRIYAGLKGCIDSGIAIPHSDEILPSDDRINGKHIPHFDSKNFDEVKKKILGA
jgi:large subunit ribosomal protein L18